MLVSHPIYQPAPDQASAVHGRPPNPRDAAHDAAAELADEVCRAFAARRFAEANRLRSALLAHNIDVRVIEPGEGVTA